MALVLADRVKETTTTTGTATYTLAGASTGFESFASIGDGNTTYYACTDGTDFEVGIGTYTASGTTLARTTILQSSNSDAAVSWSSGTKTIFCCQPAEKAVFLDASGNIAAFNGSNLTNVNATTLDSLDSTQFLRSDAADIKTSGNLHFSDNVKSTFGDSASPDLEIYHDGSHSIIHDNGTGHLILRSPSMRLRNGLGNEEMITGDENGSVSLFFDNTKRIETTSTGAFITGTLTVNSDTTLGSATHRNWNDGDTDIDGLIGGSTFGNIIEGQNSGHFVLGIRENDISDGLRIISGGGNYTSDNTYDTVIASFMCGGNVGIGTTTPSQKLEVNGTIKSTGLDVNGDLTLASTDAGATENPTLDLYRNSASPADNDVIGHIKFTGENDAGEKIQYAEIESSIIDVTDGTEDGRIDFKILRNGTSASYIELKYDAVQMNRDVFLGADVDIYFEGATSNSNETILTVVDPTADRTIQLPDASGTVALQEQAYQSINAQTGTTYTTVLADGGKLVTLSNASAITLTIPPNSSVAYPIGTKLDFIQIGAGQVTVAGGTGVTVNSTPTLKFRAQHSGASCVKIATDTWQLVGDLASS